MTRLLLKVLLALIVVASLFGHSDTSGSAAEVVTMSVRPGFDGLVRVGSWLPIELAVSNRGPDISGQLEVQVDGTNAVGSYETPAVIQSAPAVLPRYSEKRFVLEAYVPTANSRVTARLKVGDNVLVERQVPLDPMPSGQILCGLLTRNPAPLEFLPTVTLTARQYGARLAKMEIADLPTRPQVLSSLGCLIVSNPPSGMLSEGQISALRTWVAEGGLLIITGSPNWQNVAANLPPDLLPVRITGTAPVQSLASLAEFAQQPIADPGPWLATRVEMVAGTSIVEEGDLPILAAARHGAGGVFYLALDPSSEPLRSWAGNEFLWRYMLSHVRAAAPSPGTPSQQYSGWGSIPREALADVTAARLPDPQPLLILVLGYALLLVPISYLGIRRARRPGTTALLIGLTVVTATASSFAVAGASRDADLIVNKVTLVRAWDDRSPAHSHTYVSLFANRDTVYDIDTPRDTLVHGLLTPFPRFGSQYGDQGQGEWTLQVVAGERPQLRGFALSATRMGTFAVESTSPTLPASADLTVANGRLTGSVSNRSDKALQDATLVVGRQVIPLGTLEPGQSRRVEVDVSGSAPAAFSDTSGMVDYLLPRHDPSDSQLEGTLEDILESALTAEYIYSPRLDLSAVSLVAWLADNQVPVEVHGAKTTELQRTLLVATMPIRFVPGGEATIPSDLIERRPLAVNAGSKLQGRSFALSVGESASAEFTLPLQQGQFDVDSLSLNIEGSFNSRRGQATEPALGSALVFDWQRADWVEVKADLGQNLLANPQRFVSPLGTVRVRYTFRPAADSELSSLYITRFDITVGGRGR